MGITKSLAIGAAALALNTAGTNASNLAETTENTKKDLDKNISYTPSKPKETSITLAEASKLITSTDKDKNKRNKNSEADEKKLEQAKKEWNGYKDIKNINFWEDFLYVEFIYKDIYKIKYRHVKATKDDIISVTSLQWDTAEYPLEFMNSLFEGNIINHNTKKGGKKNNKKEVEEVVVDSITQQKEIEKHREAVLRRIELCVKTQDALKKECGIKDWKLNLEEDIPHINKNIIYFAIERKLKKGEDGYKKKKAETEIFYYTLVEKKQTKLDENKKPMLDKNWQVITETVFTSKLCWETAFFMSWQPEWLPNKR